MPRPYTKEEMQKHFLDYCEATLRNVLEESRKPDVESKLRLLVFSILVGIDGESGSPRIVAHDLIPSPHSSDKKYHQDKGENWCPDNVNISDGTLHDQWNQRG